MSATALALQPPESSFEQSSKKSSETPTEKESKCETLTMIMGYESSKSLEKAE